MSTFVRILNLPAARFSCEIYLEKSTWPISVAVLSKTQVLGHLLTEIGGSNPTRRIYVCLSEYCVLSLQHADPSFGGVLPGSGASVRDLDTSTVRQPEPE